MPQNFYELVWIFIIYAFIFWCSSRRGANNDWDINWGGSIAEPTFNAGNIAVTAGNYTIRFIPQCDGMNLLTLTKN